ANPVRMVRITDYALPALPVRIDEKQHRQFRAWFLAASFVTTDAPRAVASCPPKLDAWTTEVRMVTLAIALLSHRDFTPPRGSSSSTCRPNAGGVARFHSCCLSLPPARANDCQDLGGCARPDNAQRILGCLCATTLPRTRSSVSGRIP